MAGILPFYRNTPHTVTIGENHYPARGVDASLVCGIMRHGIIHMEDDFVTRYLVDLSDLIALGKGEKTIREICNECGVVAGTVLLTYGDIAEVLMEVVTTKEIEPLLKQMIARNRWE